MILKIQEGLLRYLIPRHLPLLLVNYSLNIEIQTQIKKEEQEGSSTAEVNSKVDFNASLKPYVEFTVEINKKEAFLVRFTFQIETSAHVKKLRFTSNTDKGKSVHIETIGIKIDLSFLQVEFSDLITSSSDISVNRKMKLGSKSFEIHDLSLYARHVVRK